MKVIFSVRKLSAAVLAGALLFSVTACGQDSEPAPSSSASSSESAGASASASPSASESASASASAKATGTLEDVKVEVKKDGAEAPAVTFSKALKDQSKTTAKLIQAGTGADLKEGQNLKVNMSYFDDASGKDLSEGSYATPKDIPLTAAAFQGVEAAFEILKKAKVGTTVVTHMPPSVTSSTGQVMLMHIESAAEPPKKASADEVKKLKDAGALPTAKFGDDGKPTITIPKGKDAPADLIVDVLKEGTGKAATAESTVTAKYLGVNWAKGEKFDSSYDKTPDTTPFALKGVIAGWTQGLDGIKEGSTVLLTIPRAMAYPDAAEGSATYGPLVFVVEVTKVS